MLVGTKPLLNLQIFFNLLENLSSAELPKKKKKKLKVLNLSCDLKDKKILLHCCSQVSGRLPSVQVLMSSVNSINYQVIRREMQLLFINYS